MRREKGLLAKAAMAGAARPQIVSRVVCHAGADGIELDIAVAVQHIAFTVDQTGLVTALPQCASTPMTSVELANVATSELLHKAGDGSDLWWRGQQMHMVVHQHICVQPASRVEQCFAKQRQVALAIVVVEKARQTIVAALNDVLRNVGKV